MCNFSYYRRMFCSMCRQTNHWNNERSVRDSTSPEIIEYDDHLWFIGVQFHPELKSRPFAPHPLFSSFIGAAVEQSRLV